jgi:hypothetical protein
VVGQVRGGRGHALGQGLVVLDDVVLSKISRVASAAAQASGLPV